MINILFSVRSNEATLPQTKKQNDSPSDHWRGQWSSPHWEDTHPALSTVCTLFCVPCMNSEFCSVSAHTQQFINFWSPARTVHQLALVGSTFCSPGLAVGSMDEITWNPSYRSVTSCFTCLLIIILRNLDRCTVLPVRQSYMQDRKRVPFHFQRKGVLSRHQLINKYKLYSEFRS